jgi:cysteine desulfurase
MAVYLDCNATTPIEKGVSDKVNHFLVTEFGNEGSHTHEHGMRARKAVQEARDHVGKVLRVTRNEIIFTSGATESNNIAILGLKEFGINNNKKHIISSVIEHKAVLEPFEQLKKDGFEVDLIPCEKNGRVDYNKIVEKVRSDTLLVSLMHVNNETGIIQPIKELCSALGDKDCFLHVDAAQGFGKDIETLRSKRIDLISISGHKIYGPKGIGALITKLRKFEKPPLKPLFFGGGQEHKLRPGTLPVHLIVGLGEAAKIALRDINKRKELNNKIFDQIKELINTIGGKINGDPKYLLGNCINFSIPKVDAEAFMLSTKDLIAVSNGSACTSTTYEPSHVIKAITEDKDRIRGAIRISWCHLTKEKISIAEIKKKVNNMVL